MPSAWRLVRAERQASAFDGEGAARHAGRWNGLGTPVIYAAQSRSLAVLELVVNLHRVERKRLPACVVFEVRFAERLVETVADEDLPADWTARPVPRSTRELGDAWARSTRSAVLRVPSIVVRGEFNYLLNPLHPAFRTIDVGAPEPLRWDPRLAARA